MRVLEVRFLILKESCDSTLLKGTLVIEIYFTPACDLALKTGVSQSPYLLCDALEMEVKKPRHFSFDLIEGKKD